MVTMTPLYSRAEYYPATLTQRSVSLRPPVLSHDKALCQKLRVILPLQIGNHKSACAPEFASLCYQTCCDLHALQTPKSTPHILSWPHQAAAPCSLSAWWLCSPSQMVGHAKTGVRTVTMAGQDGGYMDRQNLGVGSSSATLGRMQGNEAL